MDYEFYQLKSMPFQITPDPTFFFGSASHQEALDTLRAGIATRRGLVALTGIPGVGKTTLVRTYLARVAPPQLTTVVLWQAHLTLLDILTALTRRFEAPVAADAPEALWTSMQPRLRHEAHHGRTVALIIDAAQDLPLATLEQMLGLMAPPPAGEPLVQLVLVGRPAVQHLLAQGRADLAQWSLLHAVIQPLPPAERGPYIRQRLARVALPGGPIFTPEALTTLVRHTNGVPRDMNYLCANVLQAGFQAQQQPITPALVQEVVAASRGAPPGQRGRWRFAAVASVVLVGALLWGTSFSTKPRAPRPPLATPPQSDATAHEPTPRGVAVRAAPPPASQAPADATPDSPVAPEAEEKAVHPGPVEAPPPPPLAPPPALPPRPSLPSRGTAFAPGSTLPARSTEMLSPRHGDTVGQKISVTGVLPGLRPEHHVFVCVQSQAFGRLIYPQGQVRPDPSGHWTVQSIYATPGYRYATFLVHTTDPTAAALLSTPQARK